MERKCFFLLTLLTLVMNLSASDVLNIVSNSSSGITNASYTGILDDGSTLGFYISGTTVSFCGAISTSSSLSIPQTVSYNSGPTQTEREVVCCLTLDMDEASSVSTLTLPSTITDIRNDYFPSTITDLHLKSPNPPNVSFGSLKTITVWVPRSFLAAYQNACNNGNYGWLSSVDLHYEGWVPKSYTVIVNTPGTFGNIMVSTVSHWTDVDELTIVGHLNEDDLKLLTRLTQIRKLDLSQTDITIITGCGDLTRLRDVLLPSTVTDVDTRAFSSCSRLRNINLPGATSIGHNAFSNCSSLTTVSLPVATSIDDLSFYSCGSLTTVSLPAATSIGHAAFSNCGRLTTVSLPAVTSIDYEAFSSCGRLTTVNLPAATSIGRNAFCKCSRLVTVSLPVATYIGSSAFSGCSNLTNVDLPAATTIGLEAFGGCSSLTTVNLPVATYIGSSAFSDCSSLTTVCLPASLQSLGGSDGWAFPNCKNLKDVYCYVIVPFTTSTFSNVSSSITLHVPAVSLTAYKLHDSWYSFSKIVALDDTVDQLMVNDKFTIVDYAGLADKVDLTLGQNAHLNVNAVSAFHLSTFIQNQAIKSISNWDSSTQSYSYSYSGSTLIAGNEMKADTVKLSLQVQTNRWNFISFPFDINVSDIEYPEGTLWVIRKYSGVDRAALTGNTWQNMGKGTVLQAGEGYILHCVNENQSVVDFVFHAVNNSKKNGIFAYQDVVKPLGAFPSEHAHNRGWNLVGNPYPAFYRTTSIEHNGVITVWSPNNSSESGIYTAYSLLDDNYVLRPNEAFFVQCPVDATSMTFKAEGRTHVSGNNENNMYARESVDMAASARQVFNVTLSDDTYSDRARVVINEKAKLDYEISYDASKFMSDNPDVPQLYVIDGDVHYAIDERPLSNGVIALGMRLGRPGNYSFQLTTKGAFGQSVVLTDMETGAQTNLTKESYVFTAEPGINNSRFTLTIGDDETAVKVINEKQSSDNNVIYYDMNGRQVSGNVHGIYIVKQNGKSRKFIK